jgi:hypothetical protein
MAVSVLAKKGRGLVDPLMVKVKKLVENDGKIKNLKEG